MFAALDAIAAVALLVGQRLDRHRRRAAPQTDHRVFPRRHQRAVGKVPRHGPHNLCVSAVQRHDMADAALYAKQKKKVMNTNRVNRQSGLRRQPILSLLFTVLCTEVTNHVDMKDLDVARKRAADEKKPLLHGVVHAVHKIVER